MENLKLVFCYGLEDKLLKVRKHSFDWKEGDEITTDGKKTEIYAIFEASDWNLNLLAHMFELLNTKTSMRGVYGPNYVIDEYYDEDIDEEVIEEYGKEYNLDLFRCTPNTVKKRSCWVDYDRQLDLMEKVFTRIK